MRLGTESNPMGPHRRVRKHNATQDQGALWLHCAVSCLVQTSCLKTTARPRSGWYRSTGGSQEQWLSSGGTAFPKQDFRNVWGHFGLSPWHSVAEGRDAGWLTRALERTMKTCPASRHLWGAPPDPWVGTDPWPVSSYLGLKPNSVVNIKYFCTNINWFSPR